MENKKIKWEKPDLIEMGNAGYTLGAPCGFGPSTEICGFGQTASTCSPGGTVGGTLPCDVGAKLGGCIGGSNLIGPYGAI